MQPIDLPTQAAAALPTGTFVPAPRNLVLRAVSDRRRMGLVTPYFAGCTSVLREAGLSWFPPRRMWLCEVGRLATVLQALRDRQSELAGLSVARTRDQAALAWQHPAPDFFVEVLDLQMLSLHGGGVAVCGEFDPLVARALRGLGGRFHRPSKIWEIRCERQAVLRALYEIAGVGEAYVFVHEALGVLEDLAGGSGSDVPITLGTSTRPAAAAEAGAEPAGSAFLSAFGTPCERLVVDEGALASAAASCGLRDYQVAGVRHLLSHTSALLADDMGVGKTRQAVVAAHLAAQGGVVLVACPASLGINWEREIHAVLPQARVAMVGSHNQVSLRQAQWVIANYERLGALVRDAEVPLRVLLVDEAHYLKEPHVGRTRNAFLLAQRVERVFLLTGTPVLNREIELHTLLRLSGHELGDVPLAEFRKAYAGDPTKRHELAQRVSEWMLRRGKDVLRGLGAKTQQMRYVSPADNLAQYKAILADPTIDSMPKLSLLRQHLESLKLTFLIESVLCLGEQDKALIFCEFVDSVAQLRQALEGAGVGCVTLVGSDSVTKRMTAVDAFQQKPQVRVFIGTTMAAGVGLTLTAANYVFFASLPWTPALKRQAEDRAYRSGNERDVLVIVPLVANTIDEQIAALLDSKHDIEVSVIEANRKAVS